MQLNFTQVFSSKEFQHSIFNIDLIIIMQSIFKTQLFFKIDTKNTQLESNKKDCIRTMQSLWNSLEFNYGKDGFRAGTYQFLMRIDYSISIQKQISFWNV